MIPEGFEFKQKLSALRAREKYTNHLQEGNHGLYNSR